VSRCLHKGTPEAQAEAEEARAAAEDARKAMLFALLQPQARERRTCTITTAWSSWLHPENLCSEHSRTGILEYFVSRNSDSSILAKTILAKTINAGATYATDDLDAAVSVRTVDRRRKATQGYGQGSTSIAWRVAAF
jgi:hypothetical protein